jgi:hemerythrin-like domain-containing protein
MNTMRRQWLTGICTVGAGIVLVGCAKPSSNRSGKEKAIAKDEEPAERQGSQGAEPEVTATEDLMREHGVLRRALLVYQESALKLRANASAVPPDALQQTAKLFRAFGEEYHEKKLEEAYIFPAVQKTGGLAAAYTGVLTAQHNRGREITGYIISATSASKLTVANVEPLAKSMESLVRMYEHHAAIEDTVVFPAWKLTLNEEQMDAMNDKFEEIEHQQFGEDGYEEAVKQITDIETSLSLADLGQFTAPPPPTEPQQKQPQ